MQIRRNQIFVVVLLLLVSVYSLLIDMLWIHKLVIILLMGSLGWFSLNTSRYGYRKRSAAEGVTEQSGASWQ